MRVFVSNCAHHAIECAPHFREQELSLVRCPGTTLLEERLKSSHLLCLQAPWTSSLFPFLHTWVQATPGSSHVSGDFCPSTMGLDPGSESLGTSSFDSKSKPCLLWVGEQRPSCKQHGCNPQDSASVQSILPPASLCLNLQSYQDC